MGIKAVESGKIMLFGLADVLNTTLKVTYTRSKDLFRVDGRIEQEAEFLPGMPVPVRGKVVASIVSLTTHNSALVIHFGGDLYMLIMDFRYVAEKAYVAWIIDGSKIGWQGEKTLEKSDDNHWSREKLYGTIQQGIVRSYMRLGRHDEWVSYANSADIALYLEDRAKGLGATTSTANLHERINLKERVEAMNG